MEDARQPIRPLDRLRYLDSSSRDNSRVVGNSYLIGIMEGLHVIRPRSENNQ